MTTRRWAAAAGTLLVAAVAGCGTASPRTATPDERGSDVTPVVLAGAPDGTVPSVFGHTRESVDSLLREQGLDVRFGHEVSCDPEGRPVGTQPATGTPVGPGDGVTVLLAHQAANTDCMADLGRPWAFLDFANGRGPAPRFADEVALFVDGARSGTMSGSVAANGEWGEGSALDLLRRASEHVVRVGDTLRMPQLQVTAGTPPDVWCGAERPQEVGDREALTLSVDFADNSGSGCPARVAVFASAKIFLRSATQLKSSRSLDVVGMICGTPLTLLRAFSVRTSEGSAGSPLSPLRIESSELASSQAAPPSTAASSESSAVDCDWSE